MAAAGPTTGRCRRSRCTPGSGLRRAQLKTVRTDSTPALRHEPPLGLLVGGRRLGGGAVPHDREEAARHLPLGGVGGGAAASKASTAASRMKGRCIRGIEPGSLEIDALPGLRFVGAMASKRKSRKRRRRRDRGREPAPPRGYERSRARTTPRGPPSSRCGRASGRGAVTVGAIAAGGAGARQPDRPGVRLPPRRGHHSPGSRSAEVWWTTLPARPRRLRDVAGALSAVLGMQTLLGLTIVICALGMVQGDQPGGRSTWSRHPASSSGTLFWFLVKAMARIQMPERPGWWRGR